MKKQRKRLGSLLLAFCLVATMMPTMAFAAGTSLPQDANGVITTSLPQDANGVITTSLPQDANGVITLTEDVTWSTPYVVKDNDNVTIDLDGHTLAYNGSDEVFLDVQSGSLTIRDSKGNGEVKVDEVYYKTSNDQEKPQISCVKVSAGATFTLEGGTLTNTNTAFEATEVITNYGTTNIKGGTVKGVTGIFIYNPVRGNAAWTDSASTCTVSGGSIVGVASTTYRGSETYNNASVEGLNWSYGIAIYGPGFADNGTVDNNKSVLNISGGTITAGQAIGTNASNGRYAGYTINMTNGTVDGGTGTGMYLPAIGKTNISGGKVTAAQAIRICAGELDVTGGTITCTDVSDNSDLVAGGSGGTQGAIVVGKASGGYVGDIVVKVSDSAVVNNTAERNNSDVFPTIVVSDKNMALDSDQCIKDPATGADTGATFKYSDTSTSVSVNATIDGDIVKISNVTDNSTQDGGNTSLDITGGTVTGNVINKTSKGDLNVTGATVTGDVKNESAGSVTISKATVTGKVSNTSTGDVLINEQSKVDGSVSNDSGSVAIVDSTVTGTAPENATIVNSSVNGNPPTTNPGANVALVGGKGYESLQAAVTDAQDGDTITLLNDHAPSSKVQTIDGKDLTLDLGGYTLTQQLDVKNCHLTLRNGTVKSPVVGAYLNGGAAVYVYGSDNSNAAANSCVLDVESTATLQGYYGILISGPTYSSNDAYGAIVNVKGRVEGPIFIAGNIGNTAALTPNNNNNAVTVNILSGAKLDGNNWKGDEEGTHAIAMNGAAVVNVEDGATLIGTDAIAVKRGQLNITGGTFTATGDKIDPAEANNNGSETTGSAISVTSTYNNGTSGLSGIDINISGGTFTSQNNAAVYLGHSESNAALVGYRGGLSVDITGGSFHSAKDVPSVYVAKKINEDTGLNVAGENVAENFVTGGTFSTDLSESDYLASSVQYQVTHQAGGYSYAKTLPGAQAAAQPGDTITDLTATVGDTVTLILDYNDGATANVTYAVKSGTQVPLPRPTRTNYTFGGWSDGTNTYNGGESYAVNEAITLTAQWAYNGGSSSGGGGSSTPTYSVSAPSSVSNGSISVSPKNASKDEKVTITVNPKDGYVLDTLTVKDVDGKVVELKKEGSTVYTFKMPASKVTISATFTEETAENENPFVDVFSSDYYYDAVLWAVENGITTGLTATKFGPDQEVSRAQMVTFLWRAAGSPKATASNPFTDVKSSDYYYDAVQWAVANGVTNGTSATTFSPEAPVSRAQAVTFQWRAAGSPKVTASSFSDVSSDAYYADAVAWAVANEITNGVTATKFGPDVTVSRAQAVTFLYREAN